MAEKTLKTDWKRIGRSGPTTDGRTIDPQWLLDAAASYDKDTFAALIWPDHQRWWVNYGSVEALKTEQNKEGGVDLLAVLAPNTFYLDTNKHGQRQFFSMEIMPNFAQSGKAYLTGLAATDDPASLGTEQLQFTAAATKAGLFRSKFEEVDLGFGKPSKDDDAETISLFRRFVAKLTNSKPNEEELDMSDKATLEALQADMKKVKEQLATYTQTQYKPNEGEKQSETKPEDAVTKLTRRVDEIAAKVEAFTKPPAGEKGKEAEAAKTTDEIIEKLTKQVTDLDTKLTAALKEQPGTSAGEHAGGNADGLQAYI